MNYPFWKQERFWIGFFLVVALGLRLGSVVMNLHQPLTGDAGWYEEVGWSLSQGGDVLRHREFSRPPLYPIFISLVYRLFGRSIPVVLMIQAFLGTMTCWFVYLIGKKLGGNWIAILSLAFSAVSFSLVKVSSLLLAESLFTFLFILSILLLLHLCEKGKWGIAVSLGLILGLAILTKASMMVFPIFVLLGILFLQPWSRRKRLLLSFCIMLACWVTLLPWNIRNFVRYGRWTPICTNGGISFYSAYRPMEGKLFGIGTEDEVTQYADTHFVSDMDKSRFLFLEGWRAIKENPERLPRLELLKLAYLWSPFDWEILGERVFNATYLFVLPFAFLGMALLIKRVKDFWILYIPILYLHFISLLFHGLPRYRLPFEPLLILFSAFGLIRFFSLFSRKWVPSVSSGLWLGTQGILFHHAEFIRILAKSFFSRLGLW